MESLSMSNLPHYSSGGSVHIVVNNQLGYTTPAQNARSSTYCSDIGKMINVPVVHVNGDFPEDVARAMDVVFEYRNKFRKVIFIEKQRPIFFFSFCKKKKLLIYIINYLLLGYYS